MAKAKAKAKSKTSSTSSANRRGRTVLVTGASRGIGRAICLRLAQDGFDIVALARHQAELESLSIEVQSLGGKCRVIALDLTHTAAIPAALYGVDVDVLVNNAGVGVVKPFMDVAPNEWHQMIDVNVNALYYVTRAVLPGMIERGSGHVCTIGSIAGRSAFPGGSCYAASKAFVTSWAESLLLDVRDHGVKVSVVMPGGVATEFGGKSPSASDSWKLSASDVADAVSYVIGTPDAVLVHRLEVRTLNSPPAKR